MNSLPHRSCGAKYKLIKAMNSTAVFNVSTVRLSLAESIQHIKKSLLYLSGRIMIILLFDVFKQAKTFPLCQQKLTFKAKVNETRAVRLQLSLSFIS